MNWKEIRQSGEIFEHVAAVWRREREMPRFFRDSSEVWTKDEDSFRAFVEKCAFAYGLFDGGRLVAVVFVEEMTVPGELNIHLSVLEKVRPSYFIDAGVKLRNKLLAAGTTRICGWVLVKNGALCRLIGAIGFRRTGFRLRQGASHGQALMWECLEIARG